ncbi:seed maturation protein [Salix suchowensis]|nr:seed maturation protein [Salix suchowensis]
MTQTAENALIEQIQRGIVRNFDQRAPLVQSPPSLFQQGGAGITVGEVAEATALSCEQKPVEWSDAAAIQAAESAATINARMTKDEDKTKLSDVLAVSA